MGMNCALVVQCAAQIDVILFFAATGSRFFCPHGSLAMAKAIAMAWRLPVVQGQRPHGRQVGSLILFSVSIPGLSCHAGA